MEVLVRRCTAPVVKSGYHLRFPTSYPGFESRRAHQIRMRSVNLCETNRWVVRARQKLGVALMLVFMPINGPLWRMSLSEIGYEVPLGDFQGFALTLALFSLGGMLFILPDQKLETMAPKK